MPASPRPSTLADLGPELGLDLRVPSLDVASQKFGSVSDGVTDDTASIASAITQAGALTGPVVLAPGTTIISSRLNPTAKANISIQGASKQTSIIKAAANTNQNLVQGGTSNTFKDFTVDGNKANQSSGNGVQLITLGVLQNLRIVNAFDKGVQTFGVTDVLVQNVEVESCGGNAFDINSAVRARIIGNRVDASGGIGISMSGTGVDLVTIVANAIHNPGNIGIAGGGGSGALVSRIVSAANVVDGVVANHGIDMGGAKDTTVIGNAIYNCGGVFSSDTGGSQQWIGNIARTTTGTTGALGFGFSIVGGGAAGTSTYLANNSFLVVGNTITGVNATAVGVDSPRGEIIISSNILKNSGLNHSSSHDAILLTSLNNPMGNVLLIGNKCYDDQNVKTQEYGVNIGANTYHVTGFHNDLRGNKLGAVNDLGVANYMHGNLGYNPRGWLTAPAPAATGVILYNPFNVDCMVYINGSSAAALTAVAVGGIAAPVNATHVAITTGGTLAAATYFYRVSALNPNGETLASTETSIVTTGSTGSVIVRWTAVPGATGYNVYGRTTGAELKMATNVQATSFLDTGAITPSGALPGADTTGNTAITGWTAAPGTGSPVGIYLPWGNGIKLTYTTFVTANWQWYGL
jgi:hypothetical protein